jgi:integrase
MKVRLRDNSGSRLYRYLVEDVDRHGKVRTYFRRKGQPKIPLKEIPGTAAFEAEYQRAFSGELKPPSATQHVQTRPQSMRWLCEQYYASAAFQSLAPSTRKVRRGILEAICDRRIEGSLAGDLAFATMEPRHVAKLRDEKAAFPESANNLVKVLRQLFTWACLPEYQYAAKNPARDVVRLRSTNPDGIRAWSEADAARYESRHPIGTKARLAFDLLLYTGVRRSDVVKLGPQMERWFTEALPDGRTVEVQKLVFSETKGRARIVKTHALPILPPLRQSIDATKKQTGHLVYLVTAYGQPHSVKAFGNWFKKRCREARLEDLSAHGLRKLAAQRCAEAGATDHQLMALFGWTNPQQAAVYTKKANRAKLEASAATLLEARNSIKTARAIPAIVEQDSNKSVQPLPTVASGWTIGTKLLIINGVFCGWRPLPDSNRCCRRERALFVALRKRQLRGGQRK